MVHLMLSILKALIVAVVSISLVYYLLTNSQRLWSGQTQQSPTAGPVPICQCQCEQMPSNITSNRAGLGEVSPAFYMPSQSVIPDDVSDLNTSNCMWVKAPTREPRIQYVVCTHDPASDTYIAAHLRSKDAYDTYERYWLNAIRKTLVAYPDALFIDIGGNVGTHSLFVASLGHPVLSAEPFPENRRLFRKGVELNNFTHLVTIFPNCVSDKLEKVVMKRVPLNPAANFIAAQDPNAPLNSKEDV